MATGERPARRVSASSSKRICASYSRRLCLSARPSRLLTPHLRDIAVVLGKGAGEEVVTGAVGDEIEFLVLSRLHRGAQGGAAGVGDRAGRQALGDIGVIGRRHGEGGMAERMAARMGAVAGGKGSRGLRLQ